MIPDESIAVTLSSDTSEVPRTYKISGYKIQGYVDGIDALRQTIEKLLNTEQFEYPIYSFSYGIGLESLIGKDKLYVQMDLMRRIKDCLLQDDRIQNVENFNVNIKGETITCTFNVISIYGTTTMTKEVNV